jgi:hypothetical protein
MEHSCREEMFFLRPPINPSRLPAIQYIAAYGDTATHAADSPDMRRTLQTCGGFSGHVADSPDTPIPLRTSATRQNLSAHLGSFRRFRSRWKNTDTARAIRNLTRSRNTEQRNSQELQKIDNPVPYYSILFRN